MPSRSQMLDPTYAPPFHPHRAAPMFGLGIAFIPLTALALVLRFWSRATVRGKKFGPDDWTALASWPFIVGLNVIVILASRSGSGVHQSELPLGSIMRLMKLLCAAYFFYHLGITLIRCSVILFYYRVMVVGRDSFRHLIWLSLAFNIAWFVSIAGVTTFACRPVAAFWDPRIKNAHCFTFMSVEQTCSFTIILLDLWIAVIPYPKLWRLQMKRLKKSLNAVIFLFGYCDIFFTIGRLVEVMRQGNNLNVDKFWSFMTAIIWIVCELSLSLISICVPSVFHLVKRGHCYGVKALFNNRDYGATSRPSFNRSADDRQNIISKQRSQELEQGKPPQEFDSEREVPSRSLDGVATASSSI